ncbi:MAG: hypothetical protein BVN35_17235 [Proteobacteria bacterium ST_bin11]|nr:MAG: hypothetical protein BVN35_17235 [Proteobacteria bacterium ST_bin11]
MFGQFSRKVIMNRILQPIEIKAEWNSDKAAWIATSSLFEKLEIEAATIDELIGCVRVRILESIGIDSINRAGQAKQTFILTKSWPVSSLISIRES